MSLHGIFLGSHAVAEGWVSRRQLQSGLYRRLLQNVYADPALPADHQLYCRAAALLMPGDAALGGRSAAAWWGAPFARPAEPVLVVITPDSAWRGPRGVRVHRTAVPAAELLTVDSDIRVTSPLRTAWDLATLEPIATAVGYLDGMSRSGRLDVARFRKLVCESRGRWGARRATTAAELIDARSESPPESWVRVACVRAGLPAPVPQYVVLADGVFLGRVDLAWPEMRLIVEYEGSYHFDDLQIARDEQRYRRLVAAGWRVIRLSAAALHDMGAVVARIEGALREPLRAG